MSSPTLGGFVGWLAIAGGGCCVALFVVLLSRPLTMRDGGDTGDSQTRLATRQRLPWVWRLVWPWIAITAPWCIRFVSWPARQRLERACAKADLPAYCHPAHVCAASWVAAAVAGGGAFFVATHVGAATLIERLGIGIVAMAVGRQWPRRWLRQRGRTRTMAMERALPFYLDITVLCVEGGLSLHSALVQATTFGPAGPLRDELSRALVDMRAGAPRMEALRRMALRADSQALRAWVGALAQAETLGLPLGTTLRAQAEQRRADQYQRAERLAQEAPVKMLFPLAVCIFPCTFLMIAFPLAVSILGVE